MTKLLIQNLNDKFINNMSLCKPDFCDVIATDINGSLYDLYYKHKFTHIIFIDSLLDNECLQFAEEFGTDVVLYVYQNAETNNYQHVNKIKGLLSYIKNNDSHKTIRIPTLVNHDLYHIDPYINKTHQIVCFIDKINNTLDDIQQYLYPKSNLPIKLFNNNNIIHPQNLGLLYEKDKALLLQESKYYLAITEDYIAEAWASGCEVLTIKDLDTLVPTVHKNAKAFQSYTNFLKGLVSAKK